MPDQSTIDTNTSEETAISIADHFQRILTNLGDVLRLREKIRSDDHDILRPIDSNHSKE